MAEHATLPAPTRRTRLAAAEMPAPTTVATARRPRLLLAVNHARGTVMLTGQMGWMQRHGYDVTLLSAPGEVATRRAEAEGVALAAVPMEREIAPRADLRSLWALVRTLRRGRFDVVNAGTPKAGLLVTLAAWLTRVPVRLYTLRGLRLDTVTGPRRHLLWAMEWLTCRLAHRVIVISPSLRDHAVALGLVARERTVVIGAGSSNGVRLDRFARTPALTAAAAALRDSLGIPHDAPLVGFVGRHVRDKGLGELLAAWETLVATHPAAHLLLVGAEEPGDPIDPETRERLATLPRVHRLPETPDIPAVFAALDLFTLPSHREGFGSVLIEAAALDVPAVTSDIPGCRDAVVGGVTGTLVPAGSAPDLARAIARYLDSPALRAEHGRAAGKRARTLFRPESIWQGQAAIYAALRSGQPLPSTIQVSQ